MVELSELALKRPTASGARDESRWVGRRVLQVIEYLLTMQPWNSVRFSELRLSAMFLGHLDCRWRHPNCWGNFLYRRRVHQTIRKRGRGGCSHGIPNDAPGVGCSTMISALSQTMGPPSSVGREFSAMDSSFQPRIRASRCSGTSSHADR